MNTAEQITRADISLWYRRMGRDAISDTCRDPVSHLTGQYVNREEHIPREYMEAFIQCDGLDGVLDRRANMWLEPGRDAMYDTIVADAMQTPGSITTEKMRQLIRKHFSEREYCRFFSVIPEGDDFPSEILEQNGTESDAFSRYSDQRTVESAIRWLDEAVSAAHTFFTAHEMDEIYGKRFVQNGPE